MPPELAACLVSNPETSQESRNILQGFTDFHERFVGALPGYGEHWLFGRMENAQDYGKITIVTVHRMIDENNVDWLRIASTDGGETCVQDWCVARISTYENGPINPARARAVLTLQREVPVAGPTEETKSTETIWAKIELQAHRAPDDQDQEHTWEEWHLFTDALQGRLDDLRPLLESDTIPEVSESKLPDFVPESLPDFATPPIRYMVGIIMG